MSRGWASTGLVIAAAAFLVASFIAWFSWTQVMIPKFFPESVYRVPWSAAVLAVMAIAALVVAALSIKPTRREFASDRRRSPGPWSWPWSRSCWPFPGSLWSISATG